jgi:hypothetical protein
MEILHQPQDLQVLQGHHHVQVQVTRMPFRGNPAKLLKGINPLEAQLLETAVDCHVRFRLGGDTFPPNIYYKVFSKTNVCDINAFAPRDYSSLPREVGKEEKIKFSTYQRNRKEYESEGWYLRSDNNGWRPVRMALVRSATRCSSRLTTWSSTQPRRSTSTTTRRSSAMKNISRSKGW